MEQQNIPGMKTMYIDEKKETKNYHEEKKGIDFFFKCN